MMATASPGTGPRHILVRGVNWLGDAVMTVPALCRLRERFPDAQIDLLTPEKLGPLWKHVPAINSVLTFAPGESPWAVGRRVRQARADVGLVLPNSPRAALEVWWARIPRRMGYGRTWRSCFLTDAVPARRGHLRTRKRSVEEIKRLTQGSVESQKRAELGAEVHQVHEYLHLAAALGASPVPLAPALEVSEQELLQAAKQFGLEPPADNRPLFGLNPGAEYGAAKRWPVERFVAAAVEVAARMQCRWVIFGGTGDLEPARQIATAIEASKSKSGECTAVINLAGKTTLNELCAALKLCRVLLTNDTGPMHLAAAVGTPVVVPYGSTSPELTGPGLPGDTRHQLIRCGAACAPCFRRECPIDFRCMTGITPEKVVDAVVRVAR